MNLTTFFHELGMILGLVHGNDTTTTALTTNGLKFSTTPMILDISSVRPFSTSEDSLVSQKFLSSISTDSIHETTKNLKIFSDVDESTYPPSSTAHTTKQESTVLSTSVHSSSKSPISTTAAVHSSSKSPISTTSAVHSSSKSPISTTSAVHSSSRSPTSTDHSSSVPTHVTSEVTVTDADNTTLTGQDSTVSGSVTTDNSTITGSVTTDNSTITGSETTDNSTITGSETTDNSTITGSETTDNSTVTGSETTDNTTGTGSESTDSSSVTGATGTEVTPTSSTVTPTEKPGLTKGAVAGIVVGSLLAVAIVAAAIVFVIKQRNNAPEHRRLNV